MLHVYLLAFGRKAEAESAAAAKVGTPLPRLLLQFLASAEFADRVLHPVMRGDVVDLEPEAIAQAPVLARWASSELPLQDQTRDRLQRTDDWYDTLATVLSDHAFREAVGAGHEKWAASGFTDALLARAKEPKSRVTAELWKCDIWHATGRLIAPRWSGPPPVLEAWADGAFVGAAASRMIDRDDLPSDAPLKEFSFRVEYDLSGSSERRVARLQFREASSGAVVARSTVVCDADPDALAALRSELKRLQDEVARLDQALRSLPALQSLPLAAWASYWRRFYDVEACADPGGPQLDLILAVEDAREQVPVLERLLKRLIVEDEGAWRLILGMGPEGPSEELEELVERHARRGARVEWVCAESEDVGARLGAAMAEARSEHVVFLGRGAVLSADALRVLRGVLQTRKPPVLYWDHDHVRKDADGVEQHLQPWLKPAFDLELLRRFDYIGPTLSVSRAVAEAAGGLRREVAPVQALTRRILGQEGVDAMHLPRVLHHVVSAGAAGTEEDQTPAMDRLPSAPGAQVVARTLGSARAAVVIPTRDRVDLLKPCVESILRSASQNGASLQLCVVDNRSTQAETAEYLSELSQHPSVRVLSYDGPFNWARVNNWAASQVDAEVLVFLNNDTVVISPDWLDALCEQAMRPEVGAVGARLLFADGTLQHAGMVLTPDGATHEGLGARADEDGYLGRYKLTRRASAVTGACLAVRRDVFQRLGGFDDLNFPITFNDVDYCMKVRSEGLQVVYAPGCTLYHFEGETRGSDARDAEKLARHRRERVAFEEKWGSAAADDPFYNPHFDRAYPPFTRLAPPPSPEALFDAARSA